MAFTSAATTVVANTFVLVDPNGIIIANFGANSQYGSASNLNFLHNDPLTRDSFLHWSKVGELAAGSEELRISGPNSAGSPGGGPQISFSVAAGNNQIIELDTADAAGAFSTGLQLDGFLKQTNTFANLNIMADVNGNARGQAYGESFADAVLAGLTNIPNTGITLITLAAVDFPVAGGWIEVSATIQANVLIINDALTISIVIDGGVVRQGFWIPGPEVVGTSQVTTIRKAVLVGTGSHTVRLDAAAVTNNAYSATAAATAITAIYHR